MRGPVQVLAVEQRDEFGMIEVVVPGERDQPPDRLDRLDLVEVQLLFGLADVGVGLPSSTARKRSSLLPK